MFICHISSKGLGITFSFGNETFLKQAILHTSVNCVNYCTSDNWKSRLGSLCLDYCIYGICFSKVIQPTKSMEGVQQPYLFRELFLLKLWCN